MNLLIKHSKKIILTILLFALVITANFGLLNATITSVYATDVYGFNGFENQVDVNIQNNDFSSKDSNSNSYPYTPKNFTFKSIKTGDKVKHGLVNLNKTTYKNNYEKYGLEEEENPGLIGASDDNFSLMINSRDEASSCGYVSDEFTLKKNGIYHVSVNVYTDDVDGAASLYLFNGNKVFASIKNINAGGDWDENAYHFLIATKDYEDLTLTLGLWQGSQEATAQACVMFDEVSAGQISASTLSSLIKNTNLDGVDKTNYKNLCFVSLDGDNQLSSTNIQINSQNVSLVAEESDNIANSDYTQYFFDSTKSELKIENVKSNKVCFETGEYELATNKVYKFSILAKTEDLTTASAFFKAVEVVESNPKNATVTFSSTTNKLNDDYTEYSIIIVSDPLETKKVKFQFGLGTSDTAAKGTLHIQGIVARSVPYSEYSDASSTVSKTIDFSEDYDLSSVDNQVNNFAFYKSEATDVSLDNKVAINSPSNWAITKSTNEYNQQAGVFNVADFSKLIKTNLPNMANPGFIESINKTSNNVLMLHNTMLDKLSASSESFKLTKESYYRVSVWVNTQTEENGATIKITKKDNANLVLGSLKNINTNGEWQEHELFIKTGYEDLDVNLVLALGTEESEVKGYAFFDNCFVKTSTESAYASALNKFDLTNPLGYSDNKTPTYFKGNSKTNSNSTVSYLLNIEDLSSVLTKNDRANALNTFVGENRNVLAIHSTNTDDYYTLTSKLNYYLTSGNYYKISVDVYTAYLATNEENGVAGASVKLTNLEDGEFTGIVSPINSETNKETWATYTFFVNPDNNVTTELVLGLGSENSACHGTVLFGNINIESIDSKETYLELTQNVDDNTKVLGTVSKDEDEPANEENNTEINWQLIVYTLTAVAVIIAVLGVGFKKVLKPGKKRVKKTQPDYDRTSSMSRQKYRRLAYIKRDKDIRKLEKELALLNADRQEKEEKYKQLLSKVREVKLANRDGKLNSELSSLNKNLTKASHNVAKIGVMVNKINNEIALMKTEGYMQSLERKLIKQDELAKSKGLSIEDMILSEGEEVEIVKDSSLDDAITKADQIIEDKKEEERLALEKAEQERLEQERLAREREEQERLEQERLEQERLEQERLEKERQEKQEQVEESAEDVSETDNQEVVEESKVEENEPHVDVQNSTETPVDESADIENTQNLTESEENKQNEQIAENAQNVAETQQNAQNLDNVEQTEEKQEADLSENSEE